MSPGVPGGMGSEQFYPDINGIIGVTFTSIDHDKITDKWSCLRLFDVMGGIGFRDSEICLFCFRDSEIFYFSFRDSEIFLRSKTRIFPFKTPRYRDFVFFLSEILRFSFGCEIFR